MMRTISAFSVLMTALLFTFGCASSEEGQAEAPNVSLDVRSQETYTAGQDVVHITVSASDPQDLDLEFNAIDVPERSNFQTFRNQAVFTWDPIISDVTDDEPHRLIFAVTNSAGVTTEQSVSIYIEAGQLGTRFLNSRSQLYDPSSGQPLRFDVRVRNEQIGLVILNMPADRAPEGATFEQTDDFEGQFEWTPTPVQREKRIHSVVFEADDEDEIIEQEVTIILQDPDAGSTTPQNPTGDTCDIDDAIAHDPLSTQRTANPYLVEGHLSDASRDWVDAVLYWTFDDPLQESPTYETKVLELDGLSFAGTIPNPLVDDGDSVAVSYTICAFDADGGDDGVVCAPQEFLYRFLAYAPGDTKCRDDGIDAGDSSRAEEISTTVWQPYRLCAEAPKYHELELAENDGVELMVSFPVETIPEVDLSFNDSKVEMELLPCIGLAYAYLEGPGRALLSIAADDFPYHITAFYDDGQCPGAEYEPNNTPDEATLVVDNFSVFEELAICTADDRDVFTVELVRGDLFDARIGFEHAQGDLDMTLFAPSQASEVVENGFGVEQGWSTDDDESLIYEVEESGFHYLSVVTSGEPNEYEMTMERLCIVDDSFAGNHSRAQAAAISLGQKSGLKLCENQSDWYQLTFGGDGGEIWLGEVLIEYGHPSALGVTIYEQGGGIITQGEPAGSSVDFLFEPEPGRTYEIEIESHRAMTYELTVLEFD